MFVFLILIPFVQKSRPNRLKSGIFTLVPSSKKSAIPLTFQPNVKRSRILISLSFEDGVKILSEIRIAYLGLTRDKYYSTAKFIFKTNCSFGPIDLGTLKISSILLKVVSMQWYLLIFSGIKQKIEWNTYSKILCIIYLELDTNWELQL